MATGLNFVSGPCGQFRYTPLSLSSAVLQVANRSEPQDELLASQTQAKI